MAENRSAFRNSSFSASLQIRRLPHAVILADSNGLIVDANPAAERMFGSADVESRTIQTRVLKRIRRMAGYSTESGPVLTTEELGRQMLERVKQMPRRSGLYPEITESFEIHTNDCGLIDALITLQIIYDGDPNDYLFQLTVVGGERFNKDALTGLVNRKVMERVLDREVKRCERSAASGFGFTPLSVLMIDIDHFKRINDRHGHQVGDLAIRQIAKRLKGREVDVFARYGGEEFMAILPGENEHSAKVAAERLRRDIESNGVNMNGVRLEVTVSIGVASWQPGDEPEQMIRRTDIALYSAKHNGRNRVEFAEPDNASAREGVVTSIM